MWLETNPIDGDSGVLVRRDGLSIVIPNRFRLGNARGDDFVLEGHTFVAVLLEDIDVDDFGNGYKARHVSRSVCISEECAIRFLYMVHRSFVGLVSAVQHLQHPQ